MENLKIEKWIRAGNDDDLEDVGSVEFMIAEANADYVRDLAAEDIVNEEKQ